MSQTNHGRCASISAPFAGRRSPGRSRGQIGLLAAVLVAGCGVLEGCKPSGGPSPSGKVEPPGAADKRIAVSLLTVQHQFYQDLRDGMKEEADQLGYELLITTAEFDSARQANQIDEFIVQKVDAVVVCPCDSRSVGASIAEVNKAGIPVFTADIANTSPLGQVVSHIASDNREGGRKAAELLAKALEGRGQVAILNHPVVASVTERVAGFREGIAQHSGIEIVAELSAEGVRDRANKVMEDLLQSHPDLTGVFCINDDSALGALAAIEAAGKLERIRIVGYDATPEARARIQNGGIYGDVIQHPRQIGQLTVRAIHDHFSGRNPPPIIPVEVGTFTREGQ